jgi:hypothetical protein
VGRVVAAFAMSVAALGAEGTARADDVAPPGYHYESRDHHGIVYAGGFLFVGAWIAGVAAISIGRAFNSDLESSKVLWMALPIAGPLVELQYADKAAVKGLLVADAVVQAVGAGLIALGYALPTSVLVRDGATAVRVVPWVLGGAAAGAAGAAGLSVEGTF